jgi:hypothetical protein
MASHDPQLGQPLVGRVIAGIFGFVFAGIGLSVLGFLWFAEDGFGSPPLFFRIVGSLVAVAFVAMGGGIAFSAVAGRLSRASAGPQPPFTSGAGYRCPRCGAPLGTDTDVSPSGDVKCRFCDSWFNVHRPAE